MFCDFSHDLVFYSYRVFHRWSNTITQHMKVIKSVIYYILKGIFRVCMLMLQNVRPEKRLWVNCYSLAWHRPCDKPLPGANDYPLYRRRNASQRLVCLKWIANWHEISPSYCSVIFYHKCYSHTFMAQNITYIWYQYHHMNQSMYKQQLNTKQLTKETIHQEIDLLFLQTEYSGNTIPIS